MQHVGFFKTATDINIDIKEHNIIWEHHWDEKWQNLKPISAFWKINNWNMTTWRNIYCISFFNCIFMLAYILRYAEIIYHTLHNCEDIT